MIENLSFGFGPKLPLLLQTEATECGLTCLGMVASYYGYRIDLPTLRRRFPISLKGATLAHLIRIAGDLKLVTRPLKLELGHLNQLKLPCILHWDLNHFVVLQEVGPRAITIYDPARGIRKLPMAEVSKSFTGVALECWPSPEFKRVDQRQTVKLGVLVGRVTGLFRASAQILSLAIGLEIIALVSPFFLQWVVDNVLVSADRDLLTTLALGFGLLMLVQRVITLARSWILMVVSTSINLQWRANVFSHLLRLPIAYFEKRHLGDVASRFGSIDVIQRTLTTSFVEGVLDGMMSIVTLGMMFLYSPLLAWIGVGAMTLYAIGRWAWFQPLRNATEEQIIHAAKQQSQFLETVRGVKTIKLFGREDERRSTWLTRLVEQINADLRTQKLSLLYQSLNGLLFGIENILVIWLGAKLVLDGNFTVGVLIAFNAYKSQFDTRVSSLIDKLIDLRMMRLQGERLADIALQDVEISHTAVFSEETAHLNPSLAIENLRFRYSENEPYVLNGVSFKVQAGESIAIVGPSGSGKTTLMNIMLGLYPPTEGKVRFGGRDVTQVGFDVLRQAVGTVLQDDVLFAGSIADNICFFDAQPEQKRIEECARLAAIDEDINAMPMRYNTLVGDMGTVLSGGQKQRVLLARALYKHPQILFLDEATSHLDVEREYRVNTAIRELNITRVIVAHRPETIRTADRVIVINGGVVVQDVPVSSIFPSEENSRPQSAAEASAA
ncbi:peptidase domain-containing ABC transporter [Paraburkholderia sp. J12]|uniref:peptidase domain-containing ABC transporter n=1 Tax=Paraburkholderia sp. J12 TaxID=2805432 RepID=UPI002ABD6BF9|nr:peptidase domain-containing ABC transporter [Paraburkholderia sp. J12]